MEKPAIIKFLKKLLVFLVLNTIILIGSLFALHKWEQRFIWRNDNCESNLFITPENHNYDLVILGTSHGRIFSRDHNHARVEKILGKTMLNLSKGNGEGGITPSKVFLKYFYARGNRAKHLVYFIDPWVFYARDWNEKNFFLADEPFRPLAFRIAASCHTERAVLVNYMKSKYSPWWFGMKPLPDTINTNALTHIDTAALRKRNASLYIQPYDSTVFNHYATQVEEMIQMARNDGAKVTFIIPSTLLDDNRGKDKVIALLEKCRKKYGISWYDYANAITDPTLYYDHDHLNTRGVVYFTERYLKGVVE